MAKKKKNKKHQKKKMKQGGTLKQLEVLDLKMNNLHEKLHEELLELERYAKKKKKKINKKARDFARSGLFGQFSPTYELQKVDYEIAKTMRKKNILDAIEVVFKQMRPIVVTIARLVAYLINLIMMLPNEWKLKIPFKVWAKMERIYQAAMAIN